MYTPPEILGVFNSSDLELKNVVMEVKPSYLRNE